MSKPVKNGFWYTVPWYKLTVFDIHDSYLRNLCLPEGVFDMFYGYVTADQMRKAYPNGAGS